MEIKTDRSKDKIKQRPNSANPCPTDYPAIIVAFSLKETYDDLVTAQQMICNRYSPQNRSPQDSINSITPTNSIKMVDNDTPQPSTAKIEHPVFIETPQPSTLQIDTHEHTIAIEEKGIDGEIQDIIEDKQLVQKTSSIKTILNEPMEELEQVLDYSFNEEYQIKDEKKVSNEEQVIPEPEQLQESNSIESVVLTNIVIENEVPLEKSSEESMVVEKEPVDTNMPEILYEVKRNRKSKETKSLKRKSRIHRNAKAINKHCKYKNVKNNIHNRIGRYCNKTEKDSIHSGLIEKVLCSKSIANIVSRSSFQYAPLRTVLAKENLLEKTEVINNNEDKSHNSTDTPEISIAPLRTVSAKENLFEKTEVINNNEDKSFNGTDTSEISIAATCSDTTLIDSKSSMTSEPYTTDTENLVTETHEDSIYKSEVINIAVAVAYNTIKSNKSQLVLVKQEVESNLDKNIDLISTETLLAGTCTLTSKSSPHASETSEISTVTLVNDNSLIEVLTNDETYYIEQRNSEVAKTNDKDINPKPKDSTQASMSQRNLLDTVINLGIYNEPSPSTSSAGTYEIIDHDNVIVTGLNESYVINPNFNQDYIVSDNILKKNNLQANNLASRNLNLPNQSKIKALIRENETSQRKCAEEARHPTSFPEMWERLVSVLDLAVKRLEDTLSEKIIKELKESLISFEVKNNNKSWKDSKDVEMMGGDIKVVHKDVAAGEVRNETEQGMQCDLVSNKTIDNLIFKISTEGPKVMTPVTTESFLKIKSNIFKDLFEVLKPPQAPLVIEKSEKETVTVSTLSHASEAKFRRLRKALMPPISFCQENYIVIASVPSFLLLMACLYGVILLVIKP